MNVIDTKNNVSVVNITLLDMRMTIYLLTQSYLIFYLIMQIQQY
jgi:hypothetical protein